MLTQPEARTADDSGLKKTSVLLEALPYICEYVGKTIVVKVGGSVGEGLAAAARAAFIHGLATAELVGLAVALAGALVALAFLPARARPRPPELPPACDPERYPSCAKPPAGVSFLGRRS